MITLHPQYINDANGKKSLVVLPADEFDTIMEELEDQEDIRFYGMEDAFRIIETNRAGTR